MTLAEFLLARIEEVQAQAWAEIHDDVGYMVEIGWSPQLVIAHSESVRMAVEACDDQGVLRLLALPYASHPDYRSEWRP